jgi:DivIVA domain-containing protein
MEVTPKVFRDVQFREKARGGYHPEDVDEFLEQAAVGAEVLLERLRETTERADRAEKAATDASATDDALKRMLLMGQRTVDQAINEAHEEAERLLAAARAQASALVADAEERGRRAYEDTLAESRSKMEAAQSSLRESQQDVEALRGWVDVNRSHLLAVMRDAQGLIESAGLLGEPPRTSEVQTNVRDAAVRDTAVRDTPVEAANAPEDNGAGLDADGISVENDKAPTGEWDARLLDEVGRDAQQPAAAQSPGTEYQPATGQTATTQTETAQTETAQPTTTLPPDSGEEGDARGADDLLSAKSAPVAEAGEGVTASPGDQTLAFDERALDSFFREQDLGDERGLGRFRRRQ